MNKSKSEYPVMYGIRGWGYQEMKLWVFYESWGYYRNRIYRRRSVINPAWRGV